MSPGDDKLIREILDNVHTAIDTATDPKFVHDVVKRALVRCNHG